MKALVELFGETILIATFQRRDSQVRPRIPRKEETFDPGERSESRWRSRHARDAASGLCLASRLLDQS